MISSHSDAFPCPELLTPLSNNYGSCLRLLSRVKLDTQPSSYRVSSIVGGTASLLGGHTSGNHLGEGIVLLMEWWKTLLEQRHDKICLVAKEIGQERRSTTLFRDDVCWVTVFTQFAGRFLGSVRPVVPNSNVWTTTHLSGTGTVFSLLSPHSTALLWSHKWIVGSSFDGTQLCDSFDDYRAVNQRHCTRRAADYLNHTFLEKQLIPEHWSLQIIHMDPDANQWKKKRVERKWLFQSSTWRLKHVGLSDGL